jgi:hypothetical protein
MPKEKRNVISGLAFCLVTLVVILNFLRMHYIGGSGSAELLWNANEGYLFLYGGAAATSSAIWDIWGKW